MSVSSDSAEQMVRISLSGVEVALKLTGTAAKELALFLVAALKSAGKDGDGLKLRGKERMEHMLKSGKPLEVFSVKESDLQQFKDGAKQYGIVYCVLRDKNNSPDGLCDIMVKAEDASRVDRMVERFKFATVDKAKIEREIAKEKDGESPESPERSDADVPDKHLEADEGKAEAAKSGQAPHEKAAPRNPDAAKTTKSRLSAPSSGSKSNSAKGTSSKPSVRGELRDIAAANKKKAADAPTRETTPKSKSNKRQPAAQHTQPQGKRGANNRNSKSKGR